MRVKLAAAIPFASLLISAAPPAWFPGPAIRDVRSVARSVGDAIWPDYGRAPFGLLLVTSDGETLLCEDRLPPGFRATGRDRSTGCARATRAASGLPANLLAAMPLFGRPSTIVMGTPGATGYTPVAWRRTVLHEHFHQWQSALPGYYARTAALGLSGGDTTGMWMLNYPFPYADPGAGEAYRKASHALADALAARRRPGFRDAFDRYLVLRRAFAATVDAKAWRYLELQLWQEGVARWTEIAIARASGDAELQAEAARVEASVLDRLSNPDLKAQDRELAYPYGAGEALLLDACGPGWRRRYPLTLELGSLLEAARTQCAAR